MASALSCPVVTSTAAAAAAAAVTLLRAPCTTAAATAALSRPPTVEASSCEMNPGAAPRPTDERALPVVAAPRSISSVPVVINGAAADRYPSTPASSGDAMIALSPSSSGTKSSSSYPAAAVPAWRVPTEERRRFATEARGPECAAAVEMGAPLADEPTPPGRAAATALTGRAALMLLPGRPGESKSSSSYPAAVPVWGAATEERRRFATEARSSGRAVAASTGAAPPDKPTPLPGRPAEAPLTGRETATPLPGRPAEAPLPGRPGAALVGRDGQRAGCCGLARLLGGGSTTPALLTPPSSSFSWSATFPPLSSSPLTSTSGLAPPTPGPSPAVGGRTSRASPSATSASFPPSSSASFAPADGGRREGE